MKIIVAHPGTQHVKHLVLALLKASSLKLFFSILVFEKLGFNVNFFPQFIQKRLKIYQIGDIPLMKIIHFPLLFLLYRVIKYPVLVKKADTLFGKRVITKLRTIDFDCIIAYENSNLDIFKYAKNKGKITILDLAQVHHNEIINALKNVVSKDLIDYEEKEVNSYKSQALIYTDYIFTLSSFATQSLLKNGILKRKIFEVNLGINVDLFKLKEKYQYPNRPFRLLFVGTIMRRKGVHLLLKAWQNMCLTNSELVIIGPLADAHELIRNLPEGVKYSSFLPHEELVKEYQAADVFVFPSFLDSWGQTVVEAMACGTPVIVTENTGSKDAVLQGGGFVIPINDEQSLKEKILYFYKDRFEVERMGRAAHQIAQKYTWNNYHLQVLDALNKIAEQENLSPARG